MVVLSNNQQSERYRDYVGIEDGLHYANRTYISLDKDDATFKKIIIELVISKLINLMRKESPAFRCLFREIFGGGSVYEGTKIAAPDEFDIDILMRLPQITSPTLLENNIPGYVNLQLETFQKLELENPELYKVMQTFVDEKNYLLTKEMKNSFMQSIFDRTVKKHLPDNIVQIKNAVFQISRVQSLGPAFTLTIEGLGFRVLVDLVPCILLDESHWPKGAFKANPYSGLGDFFLVPKSPRKEMPHIERYWRLSFQKQERKIIFDRQWLKPTFKIFKRIRDHFGHKISSYALKTLFLKELEKDNPALDDEIPDLWLAPLSFCVVYMLEVYVECLKNGEIPYFWNKKLNLLTDTVSVGQIENYRRDIENMLEDIKDNPYFETILGYLRCRNYTKTSKIILIVNNSKLVENFGHFRL